MVASLFSRATAPSGVRRGLRASGKPPMFAAPFRSRKTILPELFPPLDDSDRHLQLQPYPEPRGDPRPTSGQNRRRNLPRPPAMRECPMRSPEIRTPSPQAGVYQILRRVKDIQTQPLANKDA